MPLSIHRKGRFPYILKARKRFALKTRESALRRRIFSVFLKKALRAVTAEQIKRQAESDFISVKEYAQISGIQFLLFPQGKTER